MKKILLTLIILLTVQNSFAEDIATEIDGCKELNKKMATCEKYECKMQMPIEKFKDIIISHIIKGFDETGNCAHEQSSTDGALVSCLYSKKTRLVLSGQYKSAEGEGDEEVGKYMHEAFLRECVENYGGAGHVGG